MKKDNSYKKPGDLSIFRYFFIILLLVASILTGVISALYNMESKEYLSHLELEEKVSLKFQVEVVSNHFATIISDLQYLSKQNELLTMLDHGNDAEKRLIAKEYLSFVHLKTMYDQIRYLDESGMEIVRVNYNNGLPYVVQDHDLQFKGDRYYFKDMMALKAGQVFVSPLDLNVEKGKIESPLKPMIRFGVPVFGRNKQKRGMVVFNYLGNHMIEFIKETTQLSAGNIMLVNSSGYWLCSPVSENEWGFIFKNRKQKTFPAFYPEIWNGVQKSDSAQVYNQNGLFTSATIYPLQKAIASSSGAFDATGHNDYLLTDKDYYWKIISHIPPGKLDSGTQNILRKFFFLAVLFFVLATIPSWFLAQAIVRRKLLQVKLHKSANFDKLTDLPNRSLFFERFEQTLIQAKRYDRKSGLLFIDLDGFKAVNDTVGHEGGDLLLIKISKRILHCIRETDTLARLGGDEFTIILSTIKSADDAQIVARKIIKELSNPLAIKGYEKQISASIGISIYPEDGVSTDLLIQKADHAMYEAKRDGKNDFRFAI